MAETVIKDVVVNRKARHDFFIEDTFEAGIALLGSEVKSIRAGQANLQEAWVRLGPDGAWLVGCHIAPYEQANRNNHDPLRERRLLLNRPELARLERQTKQRGLTIVPLRIYLKGSYVKVEIALAKGKKLHDKRETVKAREARRDMDRGR